MGIVPAAGYAHRLGTPSSSKELLPVYSRPASSGAAIAPVCLCLLDAMRRAGVREAHVVSRPGKEDIARYLGDGSTIGMRVRHGVIPGSRGPADTIDHAYRTVRGATVVVGFPDVLFEPADAFETLLHRLVRNDADVVLGLFPHSAGRLDRVHRDPTGSVTAIEFDPAAGGEYDTWCLAAWSPRFTELLHRWTERGADNEDEMILGKAIQAGIAEGLRVEAVRPDGAWFIDVGSPAGLQLARERLPAG